MCGRYVVTNPVSKTEKIVKSAIQVEDIQNYNAHPYQKLPVIKKYKNGNTLENLKWGLVPSWAKDKEFKALINARLETIDEKVSFKKLIKNFRCVAVADGFYEWKRENELKIHFRGALNLGISKEKLEEMILHVAHYSGFPTGVSANQILNEIVSDLEKEK